MTLEEEVLALRAENAELKYAIRRHRIMGETAESEVRDLRHRMDSAAALLKDVVQADQVGCRKCVKALAQIVLKISPPPQQL